MTRFAPVTRYVYAFDEPSEGGRELLGGKGIEPPADLFTIDRTKIVGLTIDAQRLSESRGERVRWMRGDRKYADLVEIYDELEYAAQVHRRLGCPVLEVSELSIEEIAHRIIQLVERRRVQAP